MRTLFFLLTASIPFFNAAQDSLVDKSKLNLQAVSGGVNTFVSSYQLENFKNLAPSSVVLNTTNYDDFTTETLKSNTFNFQIEAGLTLFKNKKSAYFSNSNFMFGANYFIILKELGKSKNYFVPFDTLTSSQSGTQYFVTEDFTEYLDLEYRSSCLYLTSAFRTDIFPEQSILNVELGLFANFGVGMGNTARIEYTKSSYIANSPEPQVGEFQRKTEKHYFQTSFGITNGFILGLVFQPKKSPWQRIFYEMKPSFLFDWMPEQGWGNSTFIQHTIGFRTDLWKLSPDSEE